MAARIESSGIKVVNKIPDPIILPPNPEPTGFAVGWAWVGEADTASGSVEMSITAGVDVGESAVLEYSTDANFANSTTTPTLTPNAGKVVRADLVNLPFNTLLHYRFRNGNVVGFQDAVKTPRGRGQGCKFIISSCAGKDREDRTSDHMVFKRVPELHPDVDVICFPGDQDYSDHTVNDPNLFRGTKRAVLTKPNAKLFYPKVPVGYIYDDHDFGLNNSHADRPEAPASRQVFREFVPYRPLLKSRVTGISRNNETAAGRAWTCGDVRFIMTDTRGAKKLHADPLQRTIWGQLQRDWILEEMVNAIEPLIVFIVGNSWISNVSDTATQAEKDAVRVYPFQDAYSEPTTIDSSDNFYTYYEDRRWFANILMNEAYRKKGQLLNDRTIIAHGDAHAMQLDDGSNSQYADGFVGKAIAGDTRTVVKGPLCICSGSWDSNTSYKGYPYEVNGQVKMVSLRGGYGYYDLVPSGPDLDLSFVGYQIHPTTGVRTIVQGGPNNPMTLNKTFVNQYYD